MATASATPVFPDHVPEELRWDHSLGEFAHEGDDPFVAVSRLHDGPDIIFARDASHEIPAWILTRHELVQQAFVDYEHFSSEYGSGVDKMLGQDFRLIPIDYDPPEQVSFRRVINPFFTPKAVKSLEEPVRETCDRLIGKFEDKGGCEFIEDFAIPFPTYVFLSLVGLPIDEAPQFLAWESAMLRGKTPQERGGAAMAVMSYLKEFIQQQKKNPTTDLVGGIVSASVDGKPITDMQLLGIFYTFYVGGLDTVYSTIGWMMRHLALNPDLQEKLRDNPDLVPQVVDEFARAYSVVSTKRKVKKDVIFHGVQMRKGDTVLLPLFLAGRDPKAWKNPHEIDIERRPSALPFGSGPHLCVGRHLARRELRIAMQSFLDRFRNISIAPREGYAYHTSPVFGIDRLPLVWDRI